MLRWFLDLTLHMRIAIIMTPILVIGGFGLADLWVTRNTPEKITPSATRELRTAGRCQLASSQCRLSSDGFSVVLRQGAASRPDLARIELEPNESVRGIKMSLVQKQEEHAFAAERLDDAEIWFGEFSAQLLQPPPSALRIGIVQRGRVYFAEIPAPF